jgi:hypothetical protein
VTELEILKRRRELVMLSAQLQRATIVRRVENVRAHPVKLVAGIAGSVVSVPLVIKLGSMMLTRRNRRRIGKAPQTRTAKVLALAPLALKLAPMAMRLFSAPKFFHRQQT